MYHNKSYVNVACHNIGLSSPCHLKEVFNGFLSAHPLGQQYYSGTLWAFLSKMRVPGTPALEYADS